MSEGLITEAKEKEQIQDMMHIRYRCAVRKNRITHSKRSANLENNREIL